VALTSRETALEMAGRAFVGSLFVMMSINLLQEFVETRHLTGLLLLVSESLVVVLTVVRRRAVQVDRSTAARIVTVLALLGPPLLRTSSTAAPLMADEFTALISAAGVALVIAGKITLGRSFGIVPANRGVVVKGPYGFVRHPIYAGYLVTHVAFVAAHPTPWNVAVVLIGDAALIVRALYEERVLQRDERYREYCGRVGWHLVPGVF
jgi:protein-S-isoprenylcysteine O-methyltransferase Ste14